MTHLRKTSTFGLGGPAWLPPGHRGEAGAIVGPGPNLSVCEASAGPPLAWPCATRRVREPMRACTCVGAYAYGRALARGCVHVHAYARGCAGTCALGRVHTYRRDWNMDGGLYNE